MKTRYRLIARGSRGNQFYCVYCVDTETRKRASLGTADRDAAEQIVLAKNQGLRQPSLNLQIAKAYLAASDSGVATRTWQGGAGRFDRFQAGVDESLLGMGGHWMNRY